jgi:hypothetical protein
VRAGRLTFDIWVQPDPAETFDWAHAQFEAGYDELISTHCPRHNASRCPVGNCESRGDRRPCAEPTGGPCVRRSRAAARRRDDPRRLSWPTGRYQGYAGVGRHHGDTQIGSGKFEGFDAPSGNEMRPRDESITIKAFDMDKAEAHEILGQNINFVNALPSVLNDVTVAFSMGTLAQAAEAPAEEIAKARDDAMNALQIGLSIYDALEWVYGPGAFGLRLCAWLARKAGDDLIDGLTLGMLKLRAVPAAIHSSEKIAGMAKDALAARKVSKQLEWLWRHDPRYKQVLDPKRIRAAFADHISLKRWKDQVRGASMRSLDIPLGSQRL